MSKAKLRVKLRAKCQLLRVKLTVWFLVEPGEKKQTHAKTHEHLFPLHFLSFYFRFPMCIFYFYSIQLTFVAILYNTHSFIILSSRLSSPPTVGTANHPPIRIPPNFILLISYAHAIANSIPSTHQNHTRSLLFALEYRDQPHRHIIFLLQ